MDEVKEATSGEPAGIAASSRDDSSHVQSVAYMSIKSP